MRITDATLAEFARRKHLLADWLALKADGHTRPEAAKLLGASDTTLWRFEAGRTSLEPQWHKCGRPPRFLPAPQEIACVREIYLRLNKSRVRGRGLGSSRVTAYRLAAKSEDARISELFRHMILARNNKNVTRTLMRLLDTPSAVLDATRDKSSTMTSHVSTPRGCYYVNAAGEEVVLRAGSIFEADDGTVNFPVWIPWPFGGDPCSDKFGVKVGRFQLLPVVDRRTRMCVFFHYVLRAKSSYRGEDIVALFGSCFSEVGMPEALCLERGSWESNLVKSAMAMAGVKVVRAWESKQKNAVENFFDRLWTPLSLLPGDVGRRRGENVENTDLVIRASNGRVDPREHFLGVEQATEAMGRAVSFINSEPVESKHFGRWIPQAAWEQQTDGGAALPKLDPRMKLFFAREQRTWTVRAGSVGAALETADGKMPVYFQAAALWEFEGCMVKAFFDPQQGCCTATLVLQNEWRGYKPGHVIASEVPSLELPPQAVLAADWLRGDELERGLAIRKAMAKAVRTEKWTWLGGRGSETRDGLGNLSAITNAQPLSHSRPAATPVRRPGNFPARPTQDSYAALFGG